MGLAKGQHLKASLGRVLAWRKSYFAPVGIFGAFVFTFVLYVHSEKQIDQANAQRHHSVQLSDELRQSSDDLTRLARSYLNTGDPRWKRHYQEIIGIRDGTMPRPACYDNVYWDLVGADDQRPCPFGEATALVDLMHRHGITDEELSLFKKAKAYSDVLIAIERHAMQLMESASDASGVEKSRAMAMLWDEVHHRAKANTMRPIFEFNQHVTQRTERAIESTETTALVLRYVCVFFGCLWTALLVRGYHRLLQTLGEPADLLHQHIARLGTGDYAFPLTVSQPNSVLAWLIDLQHKLRDNDTQRTRAEADLQNLNAQLLASRMQLRKLAARQESSIEEERKRVSREVHDELGQLLTAIRMDACLVQLQLPKDAPALSAQLDSLKSLVDCAIETVRHVAKNLRPTALDMGFLPALRWLCADFSQRNGISCKLLSGDGCDAVPEQLSLSVFRIVQESLTNIARHAKASAVTVAVTLKEDHLWLSVVDNGCGFDTTNISGEHTLGLLGMQERALAFGGTLHIRSAPGQGTTIEVATPLPPQP